MKKTKTFHGLQKMTKVIQYKRMVNQSPARLEKKQLISLKQKVMKYCSYSTLEVMKLTANPYRCDKDVEIANDWIDFIENTRVTIQTKKKFKAHMLQKGYSQKDIDSFFKIFVK